MSADTPQVMRRLVLANGTWQLMVVLAALSQADAERHGTADDHLVLYGGGLPDELRAAMSRLAESSGRRWSSVTWADDVLAVPEKPGGGDRGGVAGLRLRLGLDRCDEIWLCKLTDVGEKVAAEAFPMARIQVFEDGLQTYVRQPVIRGGSGGSLLSAVYRIGCLAAGRNDAWWTPGLWQRHLDRVERAWLVIPHDFGLRPFAGTPTYIDPTLLRTELDRGLSLSGFAGFAPTSPRPVALVLGQSFARWGVVEHDHERAVNEAVCRRLLADGFEVVWKDHPRLRVGFGPGLVDRLSALGPITVLDLDPSWPVEVALGWMQPAAVVSATSTSLFVAQSLFGTDSYTFARSMRLAPRWRQYRWMSKITQSTFPPPTEAWRSLRRAPLAVAAGGPAASEQCGTA